MTCFSKCGPGAGRRKAGKGNAPKGAKMGYRLTRLVSAPWNARQTGAFSETVSDLHHYLHHAGAKT